MLLLVKGIHQRIQPATTQARASVTDDTQEPRATIAAPEGSEIAKGAQRRFLYNIFRVLFIPSQIASQAKGRIEVRNHDLVETRVRCKGQDPRQWLTHRVPPRSAASPARASDSRNENRFLAIECSSRRRCDAGIRQEPDWRRAARSHLAQAALGGDGSPCAQRPRR